MGKGKRAHTISTPTLELPSLSHFLQKPAVATPQLLSPPVSPQGEPRWIAPRHPKRQYVDLQHPMEAVPFFILISTYLNYFCLILLGHMHDLLGKLLQPSAYTHLQTQGGYAPLVSDFDSFYTRRLYMRIRDCEVRECLNLASYNYLGFAQAAGPCADAVEKACHLRGLTTAALPGDHSTELHHELERRVARFVGKPDALVISMGFATNATTLPALTHRGCLLISDELNHASIIFGARLSGAHVRVFKHNNMRDLEAVLREAISQGMPRTHRPWKKIMVVVEGLYSMEGTIVNLPELVQLKKRYKFYLYVDEAHSIGALGEHGGGICDFYGIDPAHIDILMGTFTKSFGAAGGYIAASTHIIQYLRTHNHAYIYAETMPIPVTRQIMASMKIICGQDGTDNGKRRIRQLADNAYYFARRLREMGFIVYGDHGSPVVPLLLFNPAKISAFSRELLKRDIAVCVVGYPATPIISSRARFCLSAAHTREDIDRAIETISEVGDLLMLKLSKKGQTKTTLMR
ncbi:pyridoxal phosphate-dependent transferase [Syncephalastrum racemosum]|uniref:serine C-palmitoyltransferase n=1 Tax=Syncephalastrum racemosum TaxID=13706 RepID=A0A1X2HUU7_SYNRA|nr:pyridoxal phosphate-dependent transferase [Syncephalastrum racemosum]